MLVMNIKKLNSPVTLCLTNTKINAVKLTSSSRIDLDGLRERVLCARRRINSLGTVYTSVQVDTLGERVGIGTYPKELDGRGTHSLVNRCSVVISNYSGFTAQCLLDSIYSRLKGPCMCNTVYKFRKRISIFGCKRKARQGACHSLCPSRRKVLRVPPPPGKIIKIAPTMANDIRTYRILGVVYKFKRILTNGL